MSSPKVVFRAPLPVWLKAFSNGTFETQLTRLYGEARREDWRRRYLQAFDRYARFYGAGGEVVVARCPGQMNVMGMHMDYGGMPSLRMAVLGADTVTVAGLSSRGADPEGVRMRSVFVNGETDTCEFPALHFALRDILPTETVATTGALMDYAGIVCAEREARTGSSLDEGWGILPQGVLIFLESYFRGRRRLQGLDAAIWSNLSPTGGLSSSSALALSVAYAALGAHGLEAGKDIPEPEFVDGVGTSEWIRGTRGGCADHMAMVVGRRGELACIGALPSRALGRARLAADYLTVTFDSGVPRVYEDALKEETVIAYPLGTFLIREILLPEMAATARWGSLAADFRDRIRYIRDVAASELGVTTAHIFDLLGRIPQATSLAHMRRLAHEAGVREHYEAMLDEEIAGRFAHIDEEYPILLRRRIAYALAEQDRVYEMVNRLNEGDMEGALDLIRASHAGEREGEVTDELLSQFERRDQLCLMPGGYGRMTPEYDRVVTAVNDFLLESGGRRAGAVQRLGAGWGGNVGGLIHRDFVFDGGRGKLEQALWEEFGLEVNLADCVVEPGVGACLIPAPGNGKGG